MLDQIRRRSKDFYCVSKELRSVSSSRYEYIKDIDWHTQLTRAQQLCSNYGLDDVEFQHDIKLFWTMEKHKKESNQISCRI
jgi:hypothetical protein